MKNSQSLGKRLAVLRLRDLLTALLRVQLAGRQETRKARKKPCLIHELTGSVSD